jgi:hypothetical protein
MYSVKVYVYIILSKFRLKCCWIKFVYDVIVWNNFKYNFIHLQVDKLLIRRKLIFRN